MQERLIKDKAIALLKDGTVNRVLGWKRGEFFYDVLPAVFETPEEIEKDFVYNVFSGANLSKYLIFITFFTAMENGNHLKGQATSTEWNILQLLIFFFCIKSIYKNQIIWAFCFYVL